MNDVEAVASRAYRLRLMSEASLYDETLAALAVKQAEGNQDEVVFLLRAFRSTVPRKYYTRVTQSDTIDVERRISASFKDIAGGQILGAAHDYTHRLIDFDLMDEANRPEKNYAVVRVF